MYKYILPLALLATPALAGRRCIGRVTVTGGQRPTEGLARGAAWKEWRSVVRAMAGGGESYMDNRFATGERIRCHITAAHGFLKRCEVSAVPCRWSRWKKKLNWR